jgi:general secretion pathway protein G
MSYNKIDIWSNPTITTPKCSMHLSGSHGLTIIELIVVMAILGVLAMLAIPTYGQIKDKAREARATVEIRDTEKALTAFSIDRGGVFPDSLTDAAIIQQVTQNDPWGTPYAYANLNPGGVPVIGRLDDLGLLPLNTDFDLYSDGLDRSTLPDTREDASLNDIVRAGNGGYVGLAN